MALSRANSRRLAHRRLARVIAGGVRLRRVFGMIAARPVERCPHLIAHGGDRLGRRLCALLDPLHQRIERRRDFGRTLQDMAAFIRVGLR
jgi:hypothetical protein